MQENKTELDYELDHVIAAITAPLAVPEGAIIFKPASNPKATICVLVEETKDEDLVFLARILQAIDYQIDTNIDLVLYDENAPVHWTAVSTKSVTAKYLFLGVTTAQIGLKMDWQKYKVQNWHDRQFLFADTLNTIAADPNLKKALWQALQAMFL